MEAKDGGTYLHNPSTGEAEAGESRGQCQPELHRETASIKMNEEEEGRWGEAGQKTMNEKEEEAVMEKGGTNTENI